MIQHMLDDLNAELGTVAVLEVWTGTPPASVGDSDAGIMIAQLAAGNPVFGTLAGDVSDAAAFTPDTDCSAGVPSYWRLKNGSGGSTVLQWTEGDDFVTDDPDFDDGDTCSILSLAITFDVTPPGS